MLVGRDRECEELSGLVHGARLGRSGTLVLQGEAGVGKTALVQYAVQQAEGFDVLQVAGSESEFGLPYAGLHALVRPIAALIDAIPSVQAGALRVALALEPGLPPERMVVGAATLSLLSEAAVRRPLLVALDDVQWLDAPTTDAVTFAARRFAGETIALLFAAREEPTGRRGLDGLPELPVGPLDEEAAVALLRDRWGGTLAPFVARRLAAATAGNALALIEIPALLTDDERAGRATLTDPLPASEAVERSVRRSLRELPKRTNRAIMLAAADEVAPSGIDSEALAPAEEIGLVRVSNGNVAFRHPLFRAAVYHAASAAERREAHRRLAEAFAAEADADRRAWHLAAAADGPNEAAADRAEARGGTVARASALERAAELSEDESARGRRLCAAAQAAFWVGDSARAVELIDRVLPAIEDPLIHADLVQQRASVVGWRGPPTPPAVLEEEAARVERFDPERAAKLLMHAAAWEQDLDVRAPARVADRIEPLVAHLGPWWRPRAIGTVAHLRLLCGERQRALELFTKMLEDPLAAATQGDALIYAELYDEARRVLEVSLQLGRSAGQPLRVAWTQHCFGALEYALGRLPQAIAAASEALVLAEEMDQGSLAVSALLTLGAVAADQGRAEDCRATAARADELGIHLLDDHSRVSAQFLLGKLDVAEGRYAEAVDVLEPIARRLADGGFQEPSVIRYAPELIESYARLGRVVEARQELDRFTAQAEAAERRWALAAAARCEGLLADDDGFDGWFAEALARHELLASPLLLGRTLLCYGERLRRARRRREAREQLRPALEAFDRAGATPWAARTRAELLATGEIIPRRDLTAPERLTPQELQIALHVAQGKTNRDIAAALFLSPKTVEYHLTRVYRKLDLSSRAELIRLFASDTAAADLAAAPT